MTPPQLSGRSPTSNRSLTSNLVEFLMTFLVDFVREMLVELSLEFVHLKTEFPHLFTKELNSEGISSTEDRDRWVDWSKFDQEGDLYIDEEFSNTYDKQNYIPYTTNINTWTVTEDSVQEKALYDKESLNTYAGQTFSTSNTYQNTFNDIRDSEQEKVVYNKPYIHSSKDGYNMNDVKPGRLGRLLKGAYL